MSEVIWLPSANFNHGRKGLTVQRIICHITDGQPKVSRAAERLADKKTALSAHFLIGQVGERYQLVQLADTAWHAEGHGTPTDYNETSIGIEHVARSPGEFKSWSSLPLSVREKLALPGTEGLSTDPGFPLTEAQLVASAQLVAWLLCKFRLPLTAVIPHCEVPGTTHLDCGRDVKNGGIWPWDLYRELVQNEQKALESVEDLDSFAPLGSVR